MSSPGGPWADEEADGVTDLADKHDEEDRAAMDDEDINDDMSPDEDDQEPNTPSGSRSSIFLRNMRLELEAETPIKSLTNPLKKFKHQPYKVLAAVKPYSREKPFKVVAYNSKFQGKCSTLKITPNSSSEHIPVDYYKIREVGKVNSQDCFVCSLYITSCNCLEDQIDAQITIDPFADILHKKAVGKVRLQRTYCGVIVAFTKEEDANEVMKFPLQDIFAGPVQVAKFQTGESRFRQNLIIQEVPWCISNVELREALKRQGITASKIVRTITTVKVEVLSSLDMHRLLEEGLNFFNYTSFPVVLENNVNQDKPDIIQCFKCQGFWHTSTRCRQMVRCVRCGENHDVDYCPRARNDPVCCHCGGPHHAAYKMCPVRLQNINSSYMAFQLTKSRPIRSYPHNVF